MSKAKELIDEVVKRWDGEFAVSGISIGGGVTYARRIALRSLLDELQRELAVERTGTVAEALDFKQLRVANVRRLPLFKNRRGEPAHSKPDGSDWCLAQWANAVCGELGEAANIIKKIERGDKTLDEAREELANELADVQTYLDLLAFRAGIDLGEATIKKWNAVSERLGCNISIVVPVIAPPLPAVELAEVVRKVDMLVDWFTPKDNSVDKWEKRWGRTSKNLTSQDLATELRDMLGRVVVPKQEPQATELMGLVSHCWVHSGFSDCGFKHMTSSQKALYVSIVEGNGELSKDRNKLMSPEAIAELTRLRILPGSVFNEQEPSVEVKELVEEMGRVREWFIRWQPHAECLDVVKDTHQKLLRLALPRPGVKASEVGRMWDELFYVAGQCKDLSPEGDKNRFALRTAIADIEDGELQKGIWLGQKYINETLPQFFGLRVYVCDPPTPLRSSTEIAHAAMQHRNVPAPKRDVAWHQTDVQYTTDYAAALEREKGARG